MPANAPYPIRANGKLYTCNSIAVRINGIHRITAVASLDWSDEVNVEVVDSMAIGGPPLGYAYSGYRCQAEIGVYTDEANRFENLVLNESISDLNNPLADRDLISDAEYFHVNIMMSEEKRTRSILWQRCVVVGRPSRTVEASNGGALVSKYKIQPHIIFEDGRTLVDTQKPTAGGAAFGGALLGAIVR